MGLRIHGIHLQQHLLMSSVTTSSMHMVSVHYARQAEPPLSLVEDESLMGHSRAGGSLQAHQMKSESNTESMHAFKVALLCSCSLVLKVHLLC